MVVNGRDGRRRGRIIGRKQAEWTTIALAVDGRHHVITLRAAVLLCPVCAGSLNTCPVFLFTDLNQFQLLFISS